ncbi:hypothetical protein D1814_06730 [Alteromonas sp. BL110]|uniref:hypothetical protein n=1 Tax=unclassified Alteromonas TaxID=2614992 RepID=UPI000449A8F2|nr:MULTISPECIES: hypothetical protein [unclassified Alteromonas]AXT38388.1 hypothetical protein D1814_06730 [Alteromonas sp. BL110]MBT3135140.1 hypothetical protein [Alteromonas sp. ALT199]RKM83868.1 hypothetical protein D7031_02200 [Alteromonas sp. BL110]
MQNESEKQLFLDACKAQLVSLYKASKDGKKVEAEKYRVQGFMHAGEVIGLISKEQGKALIADLHMEVFGETINERAQRKRKLDALKESDLDAYFAIPAIERR